MDKTLTEQEIALLRRKLDLLLRTGQLLVESAADTNRVVRNLNRVAAYLGLPEEKLHIDVSYTMLVVNVSDGLHSFSKFQKCEKHGINMTAISEISKLSWRAIENDYSLDQYEEELERIKNKKRNYVPYVVAIGAGFACGGFCKLFGGDWMAFLFTSICAFAGFRVRARCMEFGINHYMSIAIAALISTCLAYVSSFAGLSETPYHPLLACALFIVPGVPLINFVDDMIDNYIQVGIVRAVNTVLMVCAMAFGIVIAMRLLPAASGGAILMPWVGHRVGKSRPCRWDGLQHRALRGAGAVHPAGGTPAGRIRAEGDKTELVRDRSYGKA
jgi:uncharacterized membrane protein YjjP (DUF1212 family)